ncbi:MAG: hypothetical protein ACYC64_17015 [Armatimonadota bacterium]
MDQRLRGDESRRGGRWLDFCIEKLLADRQHTLSDEVVHGLTFQELLGGLAAGKAALAADSDDNLTISTFSRSMRDLGNIESDGIVE